MQKEIEPTYYVDHSYSSSEITTISVPVSGSVGDSCSSGSSGCSAPASSTSNSMSSTTKSASDSAGSRRRNAQLAYAYAHPGWTPRWPATPSSRRTGRTPPPPAPCWSPTAAVPAAPPPPTPSEPTPSPLPLIAPPPSAPASPEAARQ